MNHRYSSRRSLLEDFGEWERLLLPKMLNIMASKSVKCYEA